MTESLKSLEGTSDNLQPTDAEHAAAKEYWRARALGLVEYGRLGDLLPGWRSAAGH